MLLSNVLAQAILLATAAAAEPLNTNDNLRARAPEGQVLAGQPILLDLEDLVNLDDIDIAKRSEEYPPLLVSRQTAGDQTQALKLHNDARAAKGVPALAWDATLASAAAAYAKQLADSGKFEHSPGSSRPGQGENLAYQYSSKPITNPISQGVQRWLDEQKNYNGQPIPQGDFASYGHYTQCVWKKTTKVGIATASDGKGAWYTVARYSPPGNYVGQTPY